MFYIRSCFYTFLLTICLPLLAFATQDFNLSDNLTLSASLSFSHAIQTNERSLQLQNTPNQDLANQPSSAMAHFPKYLSLFSKLKAKNLGSLNVRVDYLWNLPLTLGLYQKSQSVHQFLVRNLYIKIPLEKYGVSVWGGIRTFEFSPVTLFALPNPFDQIGLQGIGVETQNIQFSLSVNKGNVKTIGTRVIYTQDFSGNIIESQQLIVDEYGNPVLYGVTEYIVTAFLSGKLLLSEGRLFEPIIAFRYYLGGHTKEPTPENSSPYKAKATSALIAGGIFSRPISNGIAGTTTVWFSSLPSRFPVTTTNLPISSVYTGIGRVSMETPMNTIGVLDSSEFYFLKESGLLTAIYIANNTYPENLPVLKATADGNNLEQDAQATSNSNNRISVALEPLFFINKNLIGGVDLNLNYVSEKLFYDDANAAIASILLKWAYDEKLNSEQYLFTSLSYGIYDWKIKKFSDDSQTNNLFSLQIGAKVNF